MSSVTLAGWPHIFTRNSGAGPVLLMLHGTGSSEREIVGLAPLLDARADILAPRGRLSEGGMTRWFRRFAEGVFDTDSVISEAAALAEFIGLARDAYDLADREIVAVGVSNGANIALATAMLHPEALSAVVAFSGMHPLAGMEAGTDLSSTRVLLLNGTHDPMAPSASVDAVEATLREAGAEVTRVTRPGGHGIDARDVEAARGWLVS